MRKIDISTLFFYGIIITCNAILVGVFVPDGIGKIMVMAVSGISVAKIIYSIIWEEKQ
jgi:hypothetical protein